MLVGSNTIAADSPDAMVGLKRRLYQKPRGLGDDSTTAPLFDTTGFDMPVDPNSVILPGTAEGNDSNPFGISTTNTSTTSSSSANAISNFFSNLVTNATKAFGSTQTQCSIGTTLVGNQCLPTSTVNALALQSNPSAALTTGLEGYLPLLLGAGVLIFIMNMSKKG